jgi:acetyl esterase/lipase
MSIAFVNHRTAALVVGTLVSFSLSCSLAGCKRTEKPTEKTPSENAPLRGPSANEPRPPASGPELRAAQVPQEERPANGEVKDPLKSADSDMREVLVEHNGLGAKPISSLSVEEARKQPTLFDAQASLLKKKGKSAPPLPVMKTEDRKIPGPGGQMRVRIYTPKLDDKGKGRGAPGVVVYYHGGGLVLGDIDTYDPSARAIANGAQAIVVSADYRRAPEHKFPAAHDDALAAYEWAVKNAPSFGGDPKRVAVAGESAGGNLAANVALMARDRKDKGMQQPVHQLLIYPMAQTSLETRSYKEWANAKPLDRATMAWFFDKIVRTPQDKEDKRLQLVTASMKGAAPATIVLAEIDPLASDGEALHKRLEDEGVKTEKKTYEGVTHEFFGLGASVADAKNAEEWATGRLKDALAR